MKPTPPLVSLVLALLSAGACVPGNNRGPTAGVAGDSTSDATREASAGTEATDRTTTSQETTPVEPPPIVVSEAPSPLSQRPIIAPRPVSPYRVRIVGPSMRELRTFQHDGRTYVLGTVGERYAVVLSNPTPQRVEAVVSIDGLDAIDGTAADYVHKRGYILPAYGSATIEGFRTSLDEVATFRFSSVANSYAGRLGQARDVGVIGVAFFPERTPVAIATPPPRPVFRPDDERRPGDYNRYGGGGGSSPRPSAGAAEARKSEAAPPAASPASPAPASRSADMPSGEGLESGRQRSAEERRGLGTEFGEARESRVQETPFARANAASPSAVLAVRYNDRAGLMALGIRVDPPPVVADTELRTRETADPFRANRFALPPP